MKEGLCGRGSPSVVTGHSSGGKLRPRVCWKEAPRPACVPGSGWVSHLGMFLFTQCWPSGAQRRPPVSHPGMSLLGSRLPRGTQAPGWCLHSTGGGPACWLLRPGVQGQARPAAPRGFSPLGPRDHGPALLGFAAAPSPTRPELGTVPPPHVPVHPGVPGHGSGKRAFCYHAEESLAWAAAKCPRMPFEGLSPCARGPGLRDPEPPCPASPALTGGGTQTLAGGRPEPPLPRTGPSQSLSGTSVGATGDTHEPSVGTF